MGPSKTLASGLYAPRLQDEQPIPIPNILKTVVLVGGGTQPGESWQHFICHGNGTHENTMCFSLLIFCMYVFYM